ncbi:MAG: class II aldolase/adducin family protein [Synergistaceae bacterium]|nr:class II aldolase/adducin family protein [Synergistaceae bacterium]
MYLSDAEAKERICSIGRKMYQKQFVAANDGNITIRVGENAVMMTPTGVSKGDLTPEMLIKADFGGNILEGTYEPTSEMPMHLRIYKEDDTIQSTAHAHPIFLCCFANMGAELDLSLTTATVAISGKIPVAPYCNPGSLELAESVAPYVKDFNVVMLANHGSISWGHSPDEAWYILEEAENYAKLAILQKYILREFRPISKPQIKKLADTHGLTINPKRLVNAPDTTNNTEQASSFAGRPIPGVTLDDATIERIAEAVARKLKS